MKIFISWAGTTSRLVASVLYNWIPNVIHDADMFMSTEMEKGIDWNNQLLDELRTSQLGIICLTSDSVDSLWLNYEAGAISKNFSAARLWTFLFRMTPGDLATRSPLSRLQHTRDQRDDVLRMVLSMNQARNHIRQVAGVEGIGAVPNERVRSAFDRWWPDLESALAAIPTAPAQEPTPEEAVDETTTELRLLRDEILSLRREIDDSKPKRRMHSLGAARRASLERSRQPFHELMGEIWSANRAVITDVGLEPSVKLLENFMNACDSYYDATGGDISKEKMTDLFMETVKDYRLALHDLAP